MASLSCQICTTELIFREKAISLIPRLLEKGERRKGKQQPGLLVSILYFANTHDVFKHRSAKNVLLGPGCLLRLEV